MVNYLRFPENTTICFDISGLMVIGLYSKTTTGISSVTLKTILEGIQILFYSILFQIDFQKVLLISITPYLLDVGQRDTVSWNTHLPQKTMFVHLSL